LAGLNAAISTSAATGNWMHAFHMVEQMAGMQLIPDEISCSRVTVAASDVQVASAMEL
jgi:hypothetical protein